MRWAAHVAGMENKRNYKTVFRKPEGKIPLGGPKYIWENNKEICLK
jgi:hypothetical protein